MRWERWLLGFGLLLVLAGCGGNSKNPAAPEFSNSWRVPQVGLDGMAVWGSSGGDVFAVGGTILHWNGSAWSAVTSGTSTYLYGVWGSSGSDVFTVGGSGLILHYGP
jgi:hypothetical protein